MPNEEIIVSKWGWQKDKRWMMALWFVGCLIAGGLLGIRAPQRAVVLASLLAFPLGIQLAGDVSQSSTLLVTLGAFSRCRPTIWQPYLSLILKVALEEWQLHCDRPDDGSSLR